MSSSTIGITNQSSGTSLALAAQTEIKLLALQSLDVLLLDTWMMVGLLR